MLYGVIFQERRGDGTTTKQMQAAPQGALFIWCSDDYRGYPLNLARRLGRTDLRIVGPRMLSERGRHRFMGLNLGGIVIDHAAHLTPDQYAVLARHVAPCIRRSP